MTIFEYLTVAVSITMALAVGTLISSLPHVFSHGRRDWLHSTYVVTLLFALLIVWWRIWLFNDVTEWNLIEFAVLLGSPLSLYLAAIVLVTSNPAKISHWGAHFESNGVWLLAALASSQIFAGLRDYLIRGTTPWWLTIAVIACLAFAAMRNSRMALLLVSFPLVGFIIALGMLNFSFEQP